MGSEELEDYLGTRDLRDDIIALFDKFRNRFIGELSLLLENYMVKRNEVDDLYIDIDLPELDDGEITDEYDIEC